MSVAGETYGGFAGKKRQGFVHYGLFSLLSGYDGRLKNRNGFEKTYTNDDLVFGWLSLSDINGWKTLTEDNGWIFASLARALPDAAFSYHAHLTDMVGFGDEILYDIDYSNGVLYVTTTLPVTYLGFDSEEDEEYEDEEVEREEEIVSFSCQIDKAGRITENDKLLKTCIESEKEKLSDLLALMQTGTDDPAQLMNIGMIYETGLAGLEKNPTLAWDYYLKAAETGDKNAVEFVSEIFADENRAELRELLQNKSIGKDVFPVLFDLAQKKDNAELTAELLEYKNSLGE